MNKKKETDEAKFAKSEAKVKAKRAKMAKKKKKDGDEDNPLGLGDETLAIVGKTPSKKGSNKFPNPRTKTVV